MKIFDWVLTNFIIMTCYFLLFWFILTLHDRTGRLEKADVRKNMERDFTTAQVA